MAQERKVIKWNLSGDAMTPTKAPWGFNIRNPLLVVIPAGRQMDINLRVSTNDTTLLAFPLKNVQSYATIKNIIHIGESIIVTVENKSPHVELRIETGEQLVGVYPLIFDGDGTV